MGSFVPYDQYYRENEIDDIWRKDRFDLFVKDFKVKSAMYSSYDYITDHAGYFVRFLSTVGRKPVKRRNETLWRGTEYCMDKYWRIFDHPTVFKANNGVHFIISMPYGSQETIIDEYKKLQIDFPCTQPVDMYFIDNKYKYRKNGDFMVMYISWPLGKWNGFNRSSMSKSIHLRLDEWSQQSHPAAQASYDNLYKIGLLGG